MSRIGEDGLAPNAQVDSSPVPLNDYRVIQRSGLLFLILSLLPHIDGAELTESMSLPEIEAAISAYPPDRSNGDARAKIMASLIDW